MLLGWSWGVFWEAGCTLTWKVETSYSTETFCGWAFNLWGLLLLQVIVPVLIPLLQHDGLSTFNTHAHAHAQWSFSALDRSACNLCKQVGLTVQVSVAGQTCDQAVGPQVFCKPLHLCFSVTGHPLSSWPAALQVWTRGEAQGSHVWVWQTTAVEPHLGNDLCIVLSHVIFIIYRTLFLLAPLLIVGRGLTSSPCDTLFFLHKSVMEPSALCW